LAFLNENLPRWNNAAMSGSYPFVITMEIICGKGGQVLGKVVDGWINYIAKVANVPNSKCASWVGELGKGSTYPHRGAQES